MNPEVSLTPLTRDLIVHLRKVRVSAAQVVFSGQPDEVLGDADPDLDVHVILFRGQVAGMFRIDRGYHHRYPFANDRTPGLRTFLIDKGLQGCGVGTACCKLLRRYLTDQYPLADAVYLTVNLSNPAARKVYLAGGFIDTGAQWPLGEAGPQNILRLELLR